MTAIVERPDLSARTALSKSVLIGADLCGQKAWFELRHRLPFIPNEKVTFGSAVDAGVELVIAGLRSGQAVDEARIADAITEVTVRDGIGLEEEEALAAVLAFGLQVAPRYDFAYCRTQARIALPIDGLGDCEGHPDVILADGSVFDVKTSARAKPDDAAATSVELGFYELLLREDGTSVPRVGYWTYVRTKKPYWQIVEAPVTDEMRRRTWAQAKGYARARRADEVLNAKSPTPINYSFPSGPKNLGLCAGCQYNPANGGPCEFAVQATEEVA